MLYSTRPQHKPELARTMSSVDMSYLGISKGSQSLNPLNAKVNSDCMKSFNKRRIKPENTMVFFEFRRWNEAKYYIVYSA